MSFKASPFKLQMFDQCAHKYKLTYLDGLGDQYKTAKPYLTMGAHVHNALKDFFEWVKPEDRSFQRLEELLRIRWKQNRSGFADLEDEKMWGVKALKMLRLFFTKNDIRSTPLMLEDYYDTDLSPSIKLLGRIDRVDELDDGLHVIDYKTGKPGEEAPDSLQLILYSFIIQHRCRRKVAKASYLYLTENRWVSMEPSEKDYRAMAERVEEEIAKIEAEKVFSPTINSYCAHCDFLEICPKRDEIKRQHEQNRLRSGNTKNF